MEGITVFLIIIAALIILGITEYSLHRKNLKSIPIRIHVNGTRGKSSVTRLIAAGLREGGIRTFAKTTGSLPRMILYDGSEYPIYRQSSPNIIEQLRIISFAARNSAEALVIECMALQPYLQSLCELRFIQSTHGVITNARRDHLDVMGPEERDVALSLLGTTPCNTVLFTGERDYPDLFEYASDDRGSTLITIGDDEIALIKEEEMEKFDYIEHKENVALALSVCEYIGINRDTALRGMQKNTPDIGALSNAILQFFGRKIVFINGFAANDPESSELIWKMALDQYRDVERKIMVINSRIDRPERSRQLGQSLIRWPHADRYILIGSGSYFIIKYAVKSGLDSRLFVNAEGLITEDIFEEIISHCKKSSMIMGIGNIAGPGLELVRYFKNRAEVF
jgi:poly-gamma-glutamate synthase PgsB/CapB